MNVNHFTDDQRQALLELTLLAMYADGHLASVEDERVHRLLKTLGFATEHDRNKQYDLAVGRIRRHTETARAAEARAEALAQQFTAPGDRQSVLAVLDDLLASDRKVSPVENSYLAIIQKTFAS
jgi:hypothetical protein